MWRIYSTPDPHRSPISRLLRHTRGCGGPTLTRILTGIFGKRISASKDLHHRVVRLDKADLVEQSYYTNFEIDFHIGNLILQLIIYLVVIIQTLHSMILTTSQLTISARRVINAYKYQHACKNCIAMTSQWKSTSRQTSPWSITSEFCFHLLWQF